MSGQEKAFSDSKVVGNYLGIYFSQEQGVRLGDSSVVSRKAHEPNRKRKGWVKILTNQDAGKYYLKFVDPGLVVHLDVFHQHGAVDVFLAARLMFRAIQDYLLEDEPGLKYAEDTLFHQTLEYTQRIWIDTRSGSGCVYNLLQGHLESPSDESVNHFHILARLNSEDYGIVFVLADAAEEAIIESGLNLAKVKGISHGLHKQPDEDISYFFPIPWRKWAKGGGGTQLSRERQNALIVKLAERMGSVTEVEEFLESFSGNPWSRKSIVEKDRRWGHIKHLMNQLEDANIVKKTLFGYVLTKDGRAMKEYITHHKNELDTELKRSIRRAPSGSRRGKGPERKAQHVVKEQTCNRNKVIHLAGEDWAGGNIAVPDTVIEGRKRSFLEGKDRLVLTKEDICVYDRRVRVPVDICLLIDSSESMAGEKRQAACYLAEHLLLTGRDRLAVVAFQEMKGSVIVPFTRDNNLLARRMCRLVPGGLTPMADGIVKAVDLIRSSRASNPMLIMVSDGEPNFPLWTLDAKQDALEAAARIKKAKIKFVCIGVEADRDFLSDLTKAAGGVLYIVDDLNRHNLVEIARFERKSSIRALARN